MTGRDLLPHCWVYPDSPGSQWRRESRLHSAAAGASTIRQQLNTGAGASRAHGALFAFLSVCSDGCTEATFLVLALLPLHAHARRRLLPDPNHRSIVALGVAVPRARARGPVRSRGRPRSGPPPCRALDKLGALTFRRARQTRPPRRNPSSAARADCLTRSRTGPPRSHQHVVIAVVSVSPTLRRV